VSEFLLYTECKDDVFNAYLWLWYAALQYLTWYWIAVPTITANKLWYHVVGFH